MSLIFIPIAHIPNNPSYYISTYMLILRWTVKPIYFIFYTSPTPSEMESLTELVIFKLIFRI
jgi:hypothetical protein